MLNFTFRTEKSLFVCEYIETLGGQAGLHGKSLAAPGCLSAQFALFNQLYRTTEKSLGIFTAGSYVGALQLSK